MNSKEEILEKSRKENKDKDLYEKDLDKYGGYFGAFAGMILASIFFVIQVLVGGGMNYGVYAIALSIPAVSSMAKALKTKSARNISIALLYVIVVLVLTITQIYELIVNSAYVTG